MSKKSWICKYHNQNEWHCAKQGGYFYHVQKLFLMKKRKIKNEQGELKLFTPKTKK